KTDVTGGATVGAAGTEYGEPDVGHAPSELVNAFLAVELAARFRKIRKNAEDVRQRGDGIDGFDGTDRQGLRIDADLVQLFDQPRRHRDVVVTVPFGDGEIERILSSDGHVAAGPNDENRIAVRVRGLG